MKSLHTTSQSRVPELARWMLLSDPLIPTGSTYVFKGHYPQYLFEIVPTKQSENCYPIEYRGKTYFIMIRKDIDNRGKPPISYFIELLAWYKKVEAKPRLEEIV